MTGEQAITHQRPLAPRATIVCRWACRQSAQVGARYETEGLRSTQGPPTLRRIGPKLRNPKLRNQGHRDLGTASSIIGR